MCPDPQKEQGFTLIEVLVAFMVAALLMVIIMPAALDAASREDRAQQLDEAAALAMTLIAQRKALPPVAGEQKGRRDTLFWRTSETVIRADPRGFLALTRIDAEISGADGHRIFRGSTRRLGPAT